MNNDLAHDLRALIEAALRGPFGDNTADRLVDLVAKHIADRVAEEVDLLARDMAQDLAVGIFAN